MAAVDLPLEQMSGFKNKTKHGATGQTHICVCVSQLIFLMLFITDDVSKYHRKVYSSSTVILTVISHKNSNNNKLFCSRLAAVVKMLSVGGYLFFFSIIKQKHSPMPFII